MHPSPPAVSKPPACRERGGEGIRAREIAGGKDKRDWREGKGGYVGKGKRMEERETGKREDEEEHLMGSTRPEQRSWDVTGATGGPLI